jgi:hypothetical protein
MSTAAVFLDIEEAFDTTWHLGLLYKLSELKVLISLIKLISSFLSQRKFRVLVESEMSTPRDIKAWVPKGSVLSSTLYSIYINDTPQTPVVCVGLFAGDDRKEGYVLRKLQRGLGVTEMLCELWNIKINEDST